MYQKPQRLRAIMAEPAPAEVRAPTAVRRIADRLIRAKEEREKRSVVLAKQFDKLNSYLDIVDAVTAALEKLSNQLFRELLGVVEEKLTIALQEILEDPIKFHAAADFKRKGATVEFSIERDGNQEDVLRGTGGSVANILSVGLRLFALTTLDEQRHRRFLVLDEQDCWLRPDLVPRLVKIVHDAGKALGFQVLMISHHDIATFELYADKIYQFIPMGAEGVVVREVSAPPSVPDRSVSPAAN
jgi:ABC-type glutathione transport system ATPase component